MYKQCKYCCYVWADEIWNSDVSLAREQTARIDYVRLKVTRSMRGLALTCAAVVTRIVQAAEATISADDCGWYVRGANIAGRGFTSPIWPWYENCGVVYPFSSRGCSFRFAAAKPEVKPAQTGRRTGSDVYYIYVCIKDPSKVSEHPWPLRKTLQLFVFLK